MEETSGTGHQIFIATADGLLAKTFASLSNNPVEKKKGEQGNWKTCVNK